MNFVSVDKFVPRVMPYAENLPALVARRAVSDACREFLDETLVAVLEYRFTTTADQAEYTLSLPHGMQCAKVLAVSIGDWQVVPMHPDVTDTLAYPVDWKSAPSGKPVYYQMTSSDSVALYPVPDTAMEVRMFCAVTISRDAKDVPAVLYEDYAEEISFGALSRVFTLAGQTWSSDEKAGSYALAFHAAISKAKLEASRKFGRIGGRVVYNWWAR